MDCEIRGIHFTTLAREFKRSLADSNVISLRLIEITDTPFWLLHSIVYGILEV